ncbi:murein DD-endopeptidase MepM/ murein hydrolase activator NlpD [Desulfohalotomaculum tongense]|uniref:peptidoglycan DD-metalloendopeptidase family protein n=1 Tax=Desulforadius tongensis TaxID=1216062 RepID=UPI00195DA4E2|nr:peptidoglycan DD-metalloendopeptidase family protein [Desulforadius tongensis]MBM7856091.1 murein DD-endopeptidase MepM/ murein hydrolase activator NlpD [Desulforadius tongensis]
MSSKHLTAGEKLPPFSQLPFKKRVGWAAAAVLLIILTVVYMVNYDKAYAVVVDGRTIATVAGKSDAEAVIKELTDRQAKKFGKQVEIKQDISIKKVNKEGKSLVSRDELQRRLVPLLTYQLPGAAVKVDGEVRFVFAGKKTAEEFLAALKKEYKTADNAKVKFEEKVEVVEMPVQVDEVVDVKTALARVKENGKIPQYTVKEGDTLWDIAYSNGISVDKLIAANPGFKPELMQIGQVLKLSDKKPLINVVSVYEKTVEEKIKAPVKVKRNAKMLQGKTKVLEEGEDGLKEVKYKFIAQNGVETEKIVLAEKVIKEPKAKVVEKGTRMLVASRNFGGGRLAKPSSGGISSAFGMRWGRRHTGVDLGAPYGSPVVAAEAGRVIRAGWYGGYGKCIDIDHGNGLVTRYGHLSKIKVSVGQYVQRRQVIGNVGTTGRTTGPHLHFEVRINGVPQNPANYI